jgi:hypothetical protein
MRSTTIVGITVTAVAVLLAGCRTPSSLRYPTAPPVAQPAVGYQGFVPSGATTPVISAPAASCGPGCSSCAPPILPSLSGPQNFAPATTQ